MARRSAEELRALCGAAWHDLTESERRAAKNHKAKRFEPELNAAAAILLDAHPGLTLDEAYTQAARALDAEDNPPATEPDPTPDTPEPAAADGSPAGTADASGRILDGLWREVEIHPDQDGGIRFLDAWPEDTEDLAHFNPTARWAQVAERLKAQPQRPAVIQTGLTRRGALHQRSALRNGKRAGFTKGEFTIEIAPDHDHEGLYRLIAAYKGGKGER